MQSESCRRQTDRQTRPQGQAQGQSGHPGQLGGPLGDRLSVCPCLNLQMLPEAARLGPPAGRLLFINWAPHQVDKRVLPLAELSTEELAKGALPGAAGGRP